MGYKFQTSKGKKKWYKEENISIIPEEEKGNKRKADILMWFSLKAELETKACVQVVDLENNLGNSSEDGKEDGKPG
jgi:hypothetical protein